MAGKAAPDGGIATSRYRWELPSLPKWERRTSISFRLASNVAASRAFATLTQIIEVIGQANAAPFFAMLPVVGFINGASPAPRNFAAFVQGLKEAGFVDSQNVLIEARWAEGNYARLPAMVEELIGRHVALICTTGGLDPARTAQTATATIPIVFVIGGDPVKFGLVESLNHPGGNLTGIGLPPPGANPTMMRTGRAG
jgi:putative ABC transport system substrate-binding protein